MRPLALLTLMSFWSFVIIGFYVYLQNAREPVNQSYFLFSVVLIFVSFSEFMMRNAFSPVGLGAWVRIHLMADIFIGHFTPISVWSSPAWRI
jgi:hypothetical protein